MDLEELTKHQIVLLTLLVSFVTSIATGIVTVSLMNQAPPSVTRTINQIVEHTVQTVVPANQGAAAVTTEKTVVVKDDDLAAQSIASAQKSIIRITARGDNALVARGVIVGPKGEALTDGAALTAAGADKFDAILADGTRVPLTVEGPQASSSPITVVSVAVGTSTAWAPSPVVSSSKLRLGESVIRIGGKGVDTVGEGVIAMLPSAASGTTDTTVAASVESSTPGGILITLFGEVIGITTTDSLTQGSDTYTLAAMPAPATPAPSASETKPAAKP